MTAQQAHLTNEGAHPNDKEHVVGVQPSKNIPLAMDLACIDLIEERHHDKCIEHYCKVL